MDKPARGTEGLHSQRIADLEREVGIEGLVKGLALLALHTRST